MSEENKALVARMPLEVWSQGKLEVIDEVVDPELIEHGTPAMPGVTMDREGIKTLVSEIRRAFPDLNVTLDHMIAEGDLVVTHATSSGTMRGEFAGMPPSGKQATWEQIHISRVRDGKIVEHWVVQDQMGMLQQLGFLQAPQGMGSMG